MVTEKLYSPLEFYLHNPREEEANGEYGAYDLYDERYKIPSIDAAEHMDAIELAILRDRDRMDKTHGMAEYLSKPLGDKVEAIFPSIKLFNDTLMCVTEVKLTEPLTLAELTTLKDWWSGQLSDGWGEGFEQREIRVGREELYIVPWTSDDSFFIDTEWEFCARMGIDVPERKQDEIPETPAEAALHEPDASDSEEVAAMRDQLVRRLDINLSNYFEDLRERDVMIAVDRSFEIAAGTGAHYYLTQIYNFHTSELNYLLQFKDPLKVVGDEFEWDAADEIHSDTMWKVFHNQNALQSNYERMEADSPAENALRQELSERLDANTSDYHKNTMEAKLYSPVFCDLWEYDDDDGHIRTEISQHTAAWYSAEIRDAIINERQPEETERGLMAYYDEIDSVNEKVRSLFIGVETHGSKLWAVVTLDLTEPLDLAELIKLCNYMEGQYADGWGENFEQRDIKVDDGTLNVHLWNGDDRFQVSFFIDTQAQFAQRLGITLPPDALTETADPEFDSPQIEELVQQLRDRFRDNYNEFRRDMLDLSKGGIFDAADEILPVQNAYAYFVYEHDYKESEAAFLLKFENPLELVSDCWTSAPNTYSRTIEGIFSDQERTLQKGGYRLVSDETDHSLAASEPPSRTSTGTGEKPSVMERIRQAGKEPREHTSPKNTPGRKKSDVEL